MSSDEIKLYDELENKNLWLSAPRISERDPVCIWNDLKAGDIFIEITTVFMSATPISRTPKLVVERDLVE